MCNGPCKCTECHGSLRHLRHSFCPVCGQRDPCWGGDTLVLQPGGAAKKVRDCHVGDEVCTLHGNRRISRIWGRDPKKRTETDTEVCCIDGVWITSHHPVISGDEWVFPADLKPTAPWHKRRHIVPDMYNFELEGHDDTILLWGGSGLVVSCTIGKYLGTRFGNNICTRRSTRCSHACTQCDAVFVEGMRFDEIPPNLRWASFPDFPQVVWGSGPSEFELAKAAKCNFFPPHITMLHGTPAATGGC